jgi:hypothetical protein
LNQAFGPVVAGTDLEGTIELASRVNQPKIHEFSLKVRRRLFCFVLLLLLLLLLLFSLCLLFRGFDVMLVVRLFGLSFVLLVLVVLQENTRSNFSYLFFND